MTNAQKVCSGLVLLTASTLLVSPSQAEGGPPCAARADVVQQLTGTHLEARRAMALDPRGIVEIWVNAQTGSFSVTITTPEGVTCLLSAGEYWTDPAPLATGPAV